MLEYYQNDSNSCYLSSFAHEVIMSGENNPARATKILIEESLHYQSNDYKNIIGFIMISLKTMCVTWVSIISVITLING